VTVRPVVRYPEGSLKQPTLATGAISEERRTVANDLVETMRASPATVGLAAPQIGSSVRVFAMDVSEHPKAVDPHGLVVLFDPEILESHGEETRREGCLSVPDFTADVRRAVRVVVKGLDPEGVARVYQMEGFEARAVQHEIDHLDGLLILDRVSSSADVFHRKVYR